MIPTLPVDVVDEGSYRHLDEVWGVAQGLQKSANMVNITPHHL